MIRLQVPKGGVTALAFAPDGRSLFSGDVTGSVYRWDVAERRPDLLTRLPPDQYGIPRTVFGIYATTSGVLLLHCNGQYHTLIDAAAGRAVPPPSVLADRRADTEGRGWLGATCISGDGRVLFGRHHQTAVYTILLRDKPDEFAAVAESEYRFGQFPALSLDGTLAADLMPGADRLCLWGVGPAGELTPRGAIDQWVSGYEMIMFSPTGGLLAVGRAGTVQIWDISARRCWSEIKAGPRWVHAFAFHPDGRRLATSGGSTDVTLWDSQTGRRRSVFDFDAGNVRSLAFSPDGSLAAAGGSNRGLVVWDVDGGE